MGLCYRISRQAWVQQPDAFLALGNGTASVLLDASAAISTVSAVVSGSLTPEQAGLESGGLPGGAPAELEISVSPMPGLGGSGEGQVIGGGWYLVDNGDPAQDPYAFARGLFVDWAATGAVRPDDVDVDLMTQIFWEGIHGFTARHLVMGLDDTWLPELPNERHRDLMIDVLLAGIAQQFGRG